MSLNLNKNQSLNNISENMVDELLDLEIILIDNFDSFTYNLVNQLRPMVRGLKVFRNNTNLNLLIRAELSNATKKIIVISPGPGDPTSAGITLNLIKQFKGAIPILGICLGHQAIIQSYKGKIGAAKNIFHGKASDIELEKDEQEIFASLTSPFRAARYHSLAAKNIPNDLKVIAKCGDEVMAIKHIKHKVLGFQFHPESILTPKGKQLMENSLRWLSKAS